MNQSKVLGIILVCLSLAPVLPVITAETAQAQVLEEIVVTARAREESLEDVPSLVSVLTESDIKRAGIESADEIVALTPGVTMFYGSYAADMQVSIRGLARARDAEANFAYIIDGIHYSNPWAFKREYSDLKQVEVIKGPQGAFYGRSASSGAVIITTRPPSSEPEAEIGTSVASNGTYTADAMFSGTLIEDTLYGRFSADYRKTDGWFYNNYRQTDDELNDAREWSVNGRLLWEVNDNLTVDSKIRYSEYEGGSIAFNAAFALPLFEAFIGPDAFIDVNEQEFVFSPNVPSPNKNSNMEISVKADYDMDWGTLSAWVLHADMEDGYIADGTSGSFGFFFDEATCIQTAMETAGFPVQSPGILTGDPNTSVWTPFSPSTCDGFQYNEHNQTDTSFQVSLTSGADQRLRWQTGIYFLDLERYVGVSQQRDDGTGNLPRNFSTDLVEALLLDTFNTDVWAVFGSINYDITDTLEASVALRYDRESRSVTSHVPSPSQQTSTYIDPCNDPAFGIGGCTLDGVPIEGSPLNPAYFVDFSTGVLRDSIPDRSEDFSEWQPKVSLTWNPAENWTFFGSWGIGFKSGGFNNSGTSETVEYFLVEPGIPLGSFLLTPPGIYDKETSSSYELGFRSTLADGRLSLDGAVFYTDIDDMQFFEFYVGSFGLLRVVENIDRASLQGYELGATAYLTDNFSLSAAYSAVDGEIKEFALRTNTVGNEIPSAAEYTINVTAQYVQPLSSGMDFFTRVDYSRVGPTWFHAVQDDQVAATLQGLPASIGTDLSRSQRDAYGLFNVRVGLEADKWRASIFANNATDEDFLGEVLVVPEFGGSFVHPGSLSERFIGVEFDYRFF